MSKDGHFSTEFVNKLRLFCGTPCSVFAEIPVNSLILDLMAQDESNTKSIAVNTRKYCLKLVEIFRIVLFINYQN